MMKREEVLWRLNQCLSLESSMPIHLDHHCQALGRYGLGDQAMAELAEGVRLLGDATREHAASLARVREAILGGSGDV